MMFIQGGGEVYACGSNASGQLGVGEDASHELTPVVVEALYIESLIPNP